jgi:hypothetical protein
MAAGAVADVADTLFPVFRQYRGRAMLMAAETGVAAEVAALFWRNPSRRKP